MFNLNKVKKEILDSPLCEDIKVLKNDYPETYKWLSKDLLDALLE